MSVQDLNRVHRRYIRFSNYFKSAWTFRQFVQGLQKVFSELSQIQGSDDFQGVYGELKKVSQHLSETTADQASGMLDDVERKMVPLVQNLLAVDEQVSPGLLRLFFQRVKNYDDNILTQLVKFYLYSKEDGNWRANRMLSTCYCRTNSSNSAARHWTIIESSAFLFPAVLLAMTHGRALQPCTNHPVVTCKRRTLARRRSSFA